MSNVSSIMPLVVIPALNEQESVGKVVEQCRELRYPTLVVDDGSVDSTASVARAAGSDVLRLPFNLGVGGALRCGFRWAVRNGFTAVVQCDADGQHPPQQIPLLVEAATRGDYDLVIGSRFLGHSDFVPSRVRQIPMSFMAKLASRAAGTQLTDTTSGFRLIREPLLSQMAARFPVHYLGDTFDVTVEASRGGFKIVEIPVSMQQRTAGAASSGTLKSTAFLLRSLAAYFLGGSLNYSANPSRSPVS